VQSADIPVYDPEQNNNDSRHSINCNPHSEVDSGRLYNVYISYRQIITTVTSLKLLWKEQCTHHVPTAPTANIKLYGIA